MQGVISSESSNSERHSSDDDSEDSTTSDLWTLSRSVPYVKFSKKHLLTLQVLFILLVWLGDFYFLLVFLASS